MFPASRCKKRGCWSAELVVADCGRSDVFGVRFVNLAAELENVRGKLSPRSVINKNKMKHCGDTNT